MALPDMGKMIGPLPLGAWLAVIGGGLGIALYTKRQGREPQEEMEDGGSPPGVGEGGGPGWLPLKPPEPDDDEAPDPQTNEEWGRLAISKLIARGYPPIVSDSAIRKYLESEKLSSQEYALVNEALRILGPTPTPLPAPIFGPPTNPPPPKPPPAKPKPPPPKPGARPVRWYTPVRGDTLTKIAIKLKVDPYRVSPYQAAMKIFAANSVLKIRPDGTRGHLTTPLATPVGRRLHVPY